MKAVDSPGRDSGEWVVSRHDRTFTRPRDPRRPGGWLVEEELGADGNLASVLTIFLTNRECPWRCVFCDLWKHTVERPVAAGDIPAQMDVALGAVLAEAPLPRQVKLYNAGSFFDAGAIPPGDHPAIAARVRSFDRIVVECHPSLVGERVVRFRDQLDRGAGAGRPKFEIAMGLESVNPAVWPRLNKRASPEAFAVAASWLRREGMDVRAFVLVQPPFEVSGEAVEWARRSVEYAVEAGATVVSLIPVRSGNGALDALERAGEFTAPRLGILEEAIEASLSAVGGRGRVFADLWDLDRFSDCAVCFPARLARLRRINGSQRLVGRVACPACG